jgi:hypothetical protein
VFFSIIVSLFSLNIFIVFFSTSVDKILCFIVKLIIGNKAFDDAFVELSMFHRCVLVMFLAMVLVGMNINLSVRLGLAVLMDVALLDILQISFLVLQFELHNF